MKVNLIGQEAQRATILHPGTSFGKEHIEEIENVSTNQRLERPFWLSNRPEKHKLGKEC